MTTSPVPWHPGGVILISLLAALIVFVGSFLNPIVGSIVAFVFIWGILERERKQVYKESEEGKSICFQSRMSCLQKSQLKRFISDVKNHKYHEIDLRTNNYTSIHFRRLPGKKDLAVWQDGKGNLIVNYNNKRVVDERVDEEVPPRYEVDEKEEDVK